MQRSVELSLHSLRRGVLEFINMHKSVSSLWKPWWIGNGFIKPCLKFLELVKNNDFFSSPLYFVIRSNWFTKIPPFSLNNKRFFLFSLRGSGAGFAFQSLIIVTSAAVALKSNMEQAVEHKRLACVLFLDLYLKRSLSEHEGEKQSLVAAGTCARLPLK